MRGSVFERDNLRELVFGEVETRLGFDGDLIGVFSSSLTMVTMDGRRVARVRFVGVPCIELERRLRLQSPMSSSSDMRACRAE